MLRSIFMAIMMVVALLALVTGSVSAAPRQQTVVVDICDRTPEVQVAILTEKGGTCSTVTDTQLASITILAITGYSSAIIVPGDFAGLTTLDNLRISDSPLLTTVPANAFSAVTTSLTALQLDANSISSVDEDAFHGLSDLIYLLLHDNSIASLHKDTFDGLTALTELILKDNNIASLHEDVFDGLTALTRLLLMNNHIKVLEDGIFEDKTDLQEISMQHNRVSILDEDTFDGLANLKSVNLSFNRVSWLHKDTFHGLANLNDLNLQGNRISSLDGDIFDDLTGMQTLYLNNNNISSLDKNVFKGLTALKTLFLHRNSIESLDGDIFDGLTALTNLALSYNSLSSLPSSLFDEPTALKTLYLNDNSIASPHEDLFDGLTGLQTLYLNDNSFALPHEDLFDGLTGLSTLDLSGNTIASPHEDLFDGPTGLRTLYLNDNSIASPHVDLFDGLTGLRTLYLNDNGIASLNVDLFEGLTGLQTLYLNDNSIASPHMDLFDGLTGLRTLYLNNNGMASPHVDLFDSPTALTTLNLSNNGMASLNVDLFDGLGSLSKLDLSGNSITGLTTGVFGDLDDSLKSLYLRSNGLASLPANIFDGLTGLTSLDLSCNALTALDLARFDPFASTLTFLEISGNSFTTPPDETVLRAKLTNVGYLYTGANTVCGPPNDTGLSGLSISPVVLTTTFEPPGLNTSAMVAHDVSATTITITARDPNATIEPYARNSEPLYDDDSNTPGWQVKLPSYRNGFQWLVRAKNGMSTVVGGLIVYRAGPPASEARLHSLELSDVPLGETFDRGTQTYMATAAAGVTETTVTATPLDPDATAVIKLGGVMDADGTVNLAAGSNVVTVEVTAEDGTTMQTYTVTVTRMVSNSKPTFDDGESTMRSLPENPTTVTNVGVAVAASDSDSGDTLTYALKSGGDSGSFTIVSTSGQIQTKTNVTYDFESAKKTYTVTVTVHDGKDADGGTDTTIDATIAVTITLTNEDEPGTVGISGTQSGGSTLTASVTSDPDGAVSNVTWQWARGGAATGSFSNISGATSASYTTVSDDVNQYLRATASYTDTQGSGKSANAVTGEIGAGNSNPDFGSNTAIRRSLPENSGEGVDVVGGMIAATDNDNDDTLTYTLTGTDADSFEIDSKGQLKTSAGVTHNFDFESSKKTYTVSVSVSDNKDSAGNTDDAIDATIDVTIDVTNVNEEPAISGSATRNTPENDTAVGTYTATDPDASTAYTWSVEPADDGGKFQINSSGQLSFKIAPNFEMPNQTGSTPNQYKVTIKVTDNGSPQESDTHTINVSVTNVNEAPVITSPPATRSIPENSTAVFTFSATDVDASDTQTWSVESADDGAFFQIDLSGALSFIDAPNFEDKQDAGGNNVYNVTVKVTDAGGRSATRGVAVTVTNVNEAPVITTDSGTFTAFMVDENTETSVVIKTYTATDVDADTTLTWSLEGNDAGDFSITKNTQGHGDLRFSNVPNYEMAADADDMNDYDIRVKVKDDGIPGNRGASNQLDDIVSVTVDVEDLNEAPVVSGGTPPNFAEIEFDVVGSTLTLEDLTVPGTFTFTDDDGDDVTWSVSGDDGNHFTITKNSDGSSFISFNNPSPNTNLKPANFEVPVDMGSNNTYEIVLEARDNNSLGAMTGTYGVTVTVTNVDETPEITTTGSTHAAPSFAEIEYDAMTADLTVADYAARDEEDNQNITWSKAGTDAGDFTIDTNTGVLSFAQRPNFEMPVDGTTPPDNVYNVIVKATDTTSPLKTRELVVTVTVTNLDETPEVMGPGTTPDFPETPYDSMVTPNVVATFSARDEEGQNITWGIVANDGNIFTITKNADGDGVVTFNMPPDFEVPFGTDTGNEYVFTVEAFDGTNTGELHHVVRVTDVNETPELTGTITTTVRYDENQTNDVAAYTARDEEGAVTWSLTGTDGGDFAVDSGGVVTFKAVPNWEDPDDSDDNNVYTFTVVATDVESGTNRLTDSVAVTVTVADLEEQGVITVDDPNPSVGDTIIFTLTDPDGGIGGSVYSWNVQGREPEDAWQTLFRYDNIPATVEYTADEDHVGLEVRAVVASYQDRRGSGKSAESEPTTAVTADPISNAPPRFLGPFPQSVSEGPADRNVGDPPMVSDRENDTLTFGLTGSHSQYFGIDPSTGQIRTTQALDYETITGPLFIVVTLHDGKDDEGNVEADPMVDATKILDLAVTDVEEDGVVTLSSTEPEVGTQLRATLADGDGSVSGETWQWARSENGRTGWTNISGATSSSYTPVDADGDFFLRARVEYTDRRGVGKIADAFTTNRTPRENKRPTFPSTETGARTVEENTRAGVSIGDPVAAEDPDDDRLTYSLSGTDAAAFTIVENTGQLRTMEPLNFETKDSYSVTVEVHDGRDRSGNTFTDIDDSQSVTVTIENVEEPGVVTLTTDTATIQARVEVTAELEDDDKPTGVRWQWSRSPNGRTDWVNISGATSATYTPTLEEDQGNYIRALANYTDGHGPNKSANAVSSRVGGPPPANSAPAFPATEDGQRETPENTIGGTIIGDPVAANDLDGDTLTYSLTGTAAASFTIDEKSGQLRLAQNVMLDYEGKRTHRFTVQVTDGVNQNGDDDIAIDDTLNVTVTVTNVNEAPVVTGDATASFVENSSSAVASYTGTDPERDTLTWSVSDNDFWISDRGQLYFRTPPSFEQRTSYTVTVTATDDDETTPLSGSLVVTVTVTDAEEEGTVFITPPRGWVDAQTQFSADLTDDDGVITGETWQWARSPNGRSSWAEIADATSDSYTVTADDTNQYLRATVSYDDRRGSGKTASAVLAGRIGDVRPSVNERPVFAAATDTSSIGQGTAAGRSIGAPVRATDAETTANRSIGQGTAAGRSIGAPVQATDPDENEVLTYSLSGQDADKFDIDPATGQLRTKAVLDLEEQPKYTVTVEVYDGFDPDYDPNNEVDASITVTITVTQVARRVITGGGGGGGGFGPALTAPRFVDGFRTSRSLDVTAREGAAVGDPVAATHPNDDDVTYSLSGANAALFTVDEETGQIRLGQTVTLALGQTYTVNLTATDSSGTGAIIIVVIEVAEGVGDPYDLNRDGIIGKDEVLEAVSDYFADLIEKDEVLALVARYFAA